MEPEFSGARSSSALLLEELEILNQSLYESHTYTTSTRRTASFALPRTSIPTVSSTASIINSKNEEKISQSMRMPWSSPWRSGPMSDHEDRENNILKLSGQKEIKRLQDNVNKVDTAEKKGIWNWKPLRALSHIGKQKFSCLFSVDVVTIHGLPASMNGLRLIVCVRKKETKDGAVKTMPARVLGGVADFEETLFVKCHVYGSPNGSGKQLKFECRPFLIYVFAVDAQELDFGRSSVDLSLLVQESMEKSSEGTRVRQWDGSFDLSGKAQGAELVVKLGFQIMEKDGGLEIYGQEGLKSSRIRNSLASFGRKQSRSSFSVPSQRMTNRMEISAPLRANFEVIEDFNLDEPAPVPSSSSSVQKSEEPESKIEDHNLPEFEIVDKGVEIQDQSYAEEARNERSVSSDVVKVVMNDKSHWTTELDSIAQQIITIESTMADGSSVGTEEETESQKLDEDEETVTREFLQMLEGEEQDEFKLEPPDNPPLKSEASEKVAEADPKVFLPDLGEGLGCVVQTKDGGYLAAMNPFNIELSRKETPKLAMQLSKQLLLLSQKSMSGFEMFQKMATLGIEELSSEILSLMPLDELIGKTPGQVAFEGIASAIIQGRNTEVATSRAAQSITAVKNMATAMSTGRKDRISTGIWKANREPITLDDILAFSLQRMEAMAVEALKIQAEIADEDAPFDISSIFTFCRKDLNRLFASAVSLEDWLKNKSLETVEGEPILPATVTLSVVLQLRDPVRRYESVGGPMIVLIQATRAGDTQGHNNDDGEERFNVVSIHMGGLKVKGERKQHIWDAERQRLSATLWLVENGLVKAGKRNKPLPAKALDSLWSISSRVMADMWLKQMRNPDVKFLKQQKL